MILLLPYHSEALVDKDRILVRVRLPHSGRRLRPTFPGDIAESTSYLGHRNPFVFSPLLSAA